MVARKKDKRRSVMRHNGERKLQYCTWHEPGMVIGLEGDASDYIGYRGGVAKRAAEHVRPASAIEQLPAIEWSRAVAEFATELTTGSMAQCPADGSLPAESLAPSGELEVFPEDAVLMHQGALIPAAATPATSGSVPGSSRGSGTVVETRKAWIDALARRGGWWYLWQFISLVWPLLFRLVQERRFRGMFVWGRAASMLPICLRQARRPWHCHLLAARLLHRVADRSPPMPGPATVARASEAQGQRRSERGPSLQQGRDVGAEAVAESPAIDAAPSSGDAVAEAPAAIEGEAEALAATGISEGRPRSECAHPISTAWQWAMKDRAADRPALLHDHGAFSGLIDAESSGYAGYQGG